MKNRIVSGGTAIILGLLIALGPQFLFPVCAAMHGNFMTCHWTAQAEIGIGGLIVALGASLLLFASPKTRLGLTIGIFFSAVLALLVPHVLIGGCPMHMDCNTITFPSITVIAVLLLTGSVGNAVWLARKKE